MAKYQYKGKSKIVSEIPQGTKYKHKFIVDKCSFVLMSAYPISGVKRLGCPLSNDHYDNDVLDLHLDLINSVCKNPSIMVIGGFDVKKIFKYPRRNEFQIVENTLFQFTNSSEDLRIGLNAVERNYTVVLDATFLPSIETYKLLLKDLNISKVVYSERKSDCVGINLTSDNIINFFGYRCPLKIKGAYFISLEDFDRLRKKNMGSTFNKNKFDYEMLEELKMLGVEDNSKSMRLDENYDIEN